MKKLFFILGLITLLFACSDDDDNTPQNPIQNLKLPAEETTFLSGQSVTIEGKGFTTESQIWLRAAGTKAAGDVQAKVTAVNESSITFEVPEGVEGQQSVILKQNDQEYDLGKLTFIKKANKKEKLYTYKISDKSRQIIEINISNGEEKVVTALDYDKDYRKTLVFFHPLNAIFDVTDNSLIKVNLSSRIATLIDLDQNKDTDYSGLVIDNNNNLYAYKRSYPSLNEYTKQIVKINIDNGKEQVIATLNFDGTYFKTPIFNSTTKEIIGIEYQSLVKVNINDGTSKTILLEQKPYTDYNGLVIDDNNNVYAYKRHYPDNNHYTKQIVKIDLDNGQEEVIANLDFDGTYFDTPVFIPTTKEIVGLTDNNLTKINIINGSSSVIPLDQNQNCYYNGLTLGY